MGKKRGRPNKYVKASQIHFWVDAEQNEQVRRYAKEQHMTLTATMQEIIDAFFSPKEKKEKQETRGKYHIFKEYMKVIAHLNCKEHQKLRVNFDSSVIRKKVLPKIGVLPRKDTCENYICRIVEEKFVQRAGSFLIVNDILTDSECQKIQEKHGWLPKPQTKKEFSEELTQKLMDELEKMRAP